MSHKKTIHQETLEALINNHVPGERHDFEEWQETVSTLLINLAKAPADQSARFANMSRPEIVVSEKWSRKLVGLAKTGVEMWRSSYCAGAVSTT
ncbi:hypothetical protein ABIE16_002196 [Pseudomonas sp. 2725]|jgi:hypothetical protein|uniref:hypothetical protein n=1 Tax=Pseudomonas sp. 2725 TaxID=3156449 RepID=UPI003D24F504